LYEEEARFGPSAGKIDPQRPSALRRQRLFEALCAKQTPFLAEELYADFVGA
jgi:hypothetical protein